MPNMGTTSIRSTAPPSASLATALFSGTQQRVLGLLFGQPERSFYAKELIGLAGAGSGAVQRELARLSQSGLVTIRPVGNQRHYQANPESPIYAELCGIARKTVGLAEPLRNVLAPVAAKIQAAFVFGSVAKRQDTAVSDIDLMILSDSLEYGELFLALQAVSQQLGREVSPTILTRKEWGKRVKNDNSFVTRVMSQPKVWLIGSDDELHV
ncbi:MAG: transcriptional regulator [Burkholderiaceae bacterium]|nr:transcriptional regulator [Burkholderiaceae bacterium]